MKDRDEFIGEKVIGHRFIGDNYLPCMDEYIGHEGVIEQYNESADAYRVHFFELSRSIWYPAETVLQFLSEVVKKETGTYTDNGEGLKGEWHISKLLETVEDAKKEEDPLIGKYIKTEDYTVGKVVYRHILYHTGYIVYAGEEKLYEFYSEDYVKENLIEEEVQTLISDKSIGEDVVDVTLGLFLDAMYDILQEFAQENDMESSTTGTHEGGKLLLLCSP